MKIGIFGGTFDPPHKGHRAVADAAVKQLGLDRLILVPAASHPCKEPSATSLSPEERLRLTKLSVKNEGKIWVSDQEIRRGGVSYTVDTVRGLSAAFEGARLYLLIGADQLAAFTSWRDYRGILERVTLVSFARRASELPELRAAAEELTRSTGAEVRIIDHELVEISSTDLRDMLPKRRGREFWTTPSTRR